MSYSSEEAGTPRIDIDRRVLVCPGGHAPKVVRLGDDRLLVAARTGLTGVAGNSSVSLVESPGWRPGLDRTSRPHRFAGRRTGADDEPSPRRRTPAGFHPAVRRRLQGNAHDFGRRGQELGRSLRVGAGTVRLRLPLRGGDGAPGRRTPAHRLRRLLPGLRTRGTSRGNERATSPSSSARGTEDDGSTGA